MDKKYTICSIFIVPTLGINKEELVKNDFINAFYKDKQRDDIYTNVVYLLFKPSNNDEFREFLNKEEERTTNLIEDYDYGDYVVLIYKLNPKFEKDFSLIKLGKYSQTSLEFQEQFPKVVKILNNGRHMDELSLQFRVFIRDKSLLDHWEKRIGMSLTEDIELWSGFNEEQETLDIEKIRKDG